MAYLFGTSGDLIDAGHPIGWVSAWTWAVAVLIAAAELTGEWLARVWRRCS